MPIPFALWKEWLGAQTDCKMVGKGEGSRRERKEERVVVGEERREESRLEGKDGKW